MTAKVSAIASNLAELTREYAGLPGTGWHGGNWAFRQSQGN